MKTIRLKKMKTELSNEIKYYSDNIFWNEMINSSITLTWNGEIVCSSCHKKTKKSFGEGFCYPCFISVPEAAECIIRPELCQAHLGLGRDVEWEQKNHNQAHIVYLAASDVVKVGVTRATNSITRWIDQGASSAIILAQTPNRYTAGVLEVALKSQYTDKTNWQRMLKNEKDESINLVDEKWSLEDSLPSDLTHYFTDDETVIELNFPVLEYPTKVKSLSFEKSPIIHGKLKGIKGQYLIFENGEVLNIRKHTGFVIDLK
jgi:hypothetical protein